MKKKLIVSLMIGCFMIVSATSLFSQQRARKDSQRSRMMKFMTSALRLNMIPAKILLKMKDKIDLTDGQAKKIKDLDLNFKKLSIDMKAKMSTLNLNLEKYFSEEEVNRKKITSVIKDLGVVKTELRISQLNNLLDIRSILTAEQIKKLEKLKMERRRSMWNQKRGNFRKKFKNQ